jgi:hypothetical protein
MPQEKDNNIDRQVFQMQKKGFEDIAKAVKTTGVELRVIGGENISAMITKGDKGDKGDTGKDGKDSTVPGPQGKTGPKGDAGKDGKDGAKGDTGPQGPAGQNGKDSTVPGPQGPIGPKGKDGSPDKPEEIITKLRSVKKTWLPIDAIEGDWSTKIPRAANNFYTRRITELMDVDLSGLTQTNGKYVLGSGGTGGAVDSVNGATGVVVLDTGDIAEVTDKKYITDAEETAIGTIAFKLPLAGGTMTGALVNVVDNTDNYVPITLTQNDTTNNPVAVSITNAGTGNSIFVDANGDTGTSASASGAVVINNTGNDGFGLNVYSNNGATEDGALVFIKQDNVAADKEALRIIHDGIGPSLRIEQTLADTQDEGVIEINNASTSGVGLHITHTSAANSQGMIRLDGPSPEIEFVETDQTTPAGKWEIRAQDKFFGLNSRKSDDSGFEKIIGFDALKEGGNMWFALPASGEHPVVNSRLSIVGTSETNFFSCSSDTTGPSGGEGTTLNDKFAIDSSGNTFVGGSINLGHATDTTISRVSAGVISIEGKTLSGVNTGDEYIKPTDHNLKAWNYDPIIVNGSSVALATAGKLYVFKIKINESVSITNIIAHCTVAGATLTAGQCFAALYQNGSLVGQSADQSTAWASTGTMTMALAGGPYAVSAGYVYAALWFNGTTGPTFYRSGGTTEMVNMGLTAANSRFGTADTSITTTAPASLGAITALNIAVWVGLS